MTELEAKAKDCIENHIHKEEMKKEEAKNYFNNLGCADKFILSKKRCAFYWWERDYWGECDEGCRLCTHNCRTRILCYLPYFIQKIILGIMEYVEGKRTEKLFKE